MGPPPEGGGEVWSPDEIGVLVRFNGAASRRRRRVAESDQTHEALALQWGRLPKEAERSCKRG